MAPYHTRVTARRTLYQYMDLKGFLRAQHQTAEGKAIPYHPALADPGVVPTYTDGSKRVRTPFGQREAARHLQAYGGNNDAIDWVMNCIKLIVETASNAEWHFEKDGEKFYIGGEKDRPDGSKEAPLMLAKLFEEPNPFMSLEELIELTLIDYLLVGNAYWLKWRTNDAGQPLALYRLAPPFVKVVPGEFGVESYEYDVPGRGKLKLDPSQIMHFRQANPHSPYYGMGVIQGGSRMLDLELALTDTQASYYEKRAQPSMVVQSDRRVPNDVFKRMQNQLRQMYGGPRNAGALMVLESGLKYQSIAPSASDAAFAEMSRLSRDRIMAMFRVPGSLLGLGDATAVAGNPSNDQRIFDTKTMRPLLNKFQNAISRGITAAWDMKLVIDYDYIMPVEDRVRLTSSFAAIPGVRVREVREYAGLEPLGDPVIDDMVLNLPGEDQTGNNPDNNLAGEAGRPPNPSNTTAFPANGEIPAGAAARRTSLAAADNAKTIVTPETPLEELETILDRFKAVTAKKEAEEAAAKAMTQAPSITDLRDRVTPPDDVLVEDRVAAVDMVAASLEQDIKDAVHLLERGLLDEVQNAVEGKAPGDRIRSRLRGSEAWKAFMASLSGAMERAAKTAISSSVAQQARLGRKTTEIDYEQLAREIVYRSGGARKITQNFKDEVAQKVAKALDEGQTRQDVERAIRESMDFWRQGHAETVALTEATHAYNEGTLTVAELHGDTHVFVHDGDDHDAPCVQANGSVWAIEDARARRLEHPRCRRAFTPLSLEGVA